MSWRKRLVMRGLRLPAEPQPPAGAPDSVRVFRAAPNYYRLALARWGLRQLSVLVGLLLVFGFWQPMQEFLYLELNAEAVNESIPLRSWMERLGLAQIERIEDEPDKVSVSFGRLWLWLEWLGAGLFLLQLPLTYTLVQLNYELRWYITTDRSLRVREGLTGLRESTMTFGNIQNLSIQQGPLQRLLDIADLRVRTAGGGSRKSEDDGDDEKQRDSLHVAYLRGIANAEEVRDLILAHQRRRQPDVAPHPVVTAPATDPVAAARQALRQASGLRAMLESRL